MNTRSIRFRLIVWHAGLLTGVFLMFGLAIYAGVKSHLERNLADSQFRRANQIAGTLLKDIQKTGERYVVDEINARYAPEINGRYLRITRANGDVLYVSGKPKDLSFDPVSLPALRNPGPNAFTRKEECVDGKRLLLATTPFTNGQQERFFLEAGAPLEPIQAVLNRLLFWLALGLPLVVAVAVGGGHVLVKRALAPVETIGRSAEQITLHHLSERLPVTRTGDELERLSSALNNMITRLDEAFQHNRRFMADASHELRTPLTIIRGELEAVVQRAGLSPNLRDTIGNVLEEVERLAKIVESLFALAKLEAGEAQAKWARFDLAKLATSTAEQMCLLAEDKGISISCDAPTPVPVEGDSARLKQVVVNLLDNAIKYTPQGGAVRLSVGEASSKAVLEVTDNGIGIPPNEQPHVFERFFRVDKARSRDLGGAGLGLAIVKSICTAHGGQVAVQSSGGHGSRFTIELPLARAGNGKP